MSNYFNDPIKPKPKREYMPRPPRPPRPKQYRLLKDGVNVYESTYEPGFALFLIRELKPEHTWTLEKIEQVES